VSILSDDLREMPILIEGLKKLNKSDPAVDYYVQDNGEHILVTAGEVHLERCVKDLEDNLAKIKFKISTPIVNFKEGLNNMIYNRRNKKKGKKVLESLEKKDRKMELNYTYVLDEGDENIDVFNQNEMLKSATPQLLVHKDEQIKVKKPEVKIKNKVNDIKNKTGKTDNFLEKTRKEEKDEKKTDIGYAEDITPNQFCGFSVSAVGMSKEVIEHIEKHENLLRDITNKNFIVSKEIYKSVELFKETLLNLIENKKLKKLVENNLYCFSPNNCGPNMLIIRNISKANNFFSRIITEESCIEEQHEGTALETKCEEEKSIVSASVGATGIKTSIEDELSLHIKEQFSINEFFIAVKSGTDFATTNGPLCEENMYGVIFIIEEINFKKETTTTTSTTDEKKEVTTVTSNDDKLSSVIETEEIKEEFKSVEDKSLSSRYNMFGPFLGQVIGTIKDCCRKAFLNGEPRLYEGMYLCTFQINNDNIGKIHSVINKRRGSVSIILNNPIDHRRVIKRRRFNF
jgi:translation elongation factor EF-G